MSPELTHEQMEKALASIDIPACPAVVNEVMNEAQKDAPDLAVLSRVIASDVGMAAFALKLANSTLYRRGGVTNSVQTAVTRLGTRNVVCIVVAVALRNSMSGDLPADVLERFWSKAGKTALLASMTARRLKGVAADMAYTYALFHDAAMPAMMRRFKGYGPAIEQAMAAGETLVNAENRLFHCTHALVGGLLARNWGLPLEIAESIRRHHDADVYDTGKSALAGQSQALVAVTRVAEHLLARSQAEPEEEGPESLAAALDHLGLHSEDLEDLLESAHETLA